MSELKRLSNDDLRKLTASLETSTEATLQMVIAEGLVDQFRDDLLSVCAEVARLRRQLAVYAAPLTDSKVAVAIGQVRELAATLDAVQWLGDDDRGALGLVCNAAEQAERPRPDAEDAVRWRNVQSHCIAIGKNGRVVIFECAEDEAMGGEDGLACSVLPAEETNQWADAAFGNRLEAPDAD